jgi:predicted site-specific integrase-resolvase
LTHCDDTQPSHSDPRIARTEAELAERWGISRRTLQRWRREGRAPVFLRLGRRIFYKIADIERFEEAAQVRAGDSS